MQFSINADIACAYGGSDAALILQHFFYWIRHNKKHNKNFHDGRYWTYNSLRELAEKFPFISRNKLRGIINRFIESGILTTGNYNKHRYDRTMWYAFTDEGIFTRIDRLLHPQMDLPKNENAHSENHPTIPTSKQIHKQEEVPSKQSEHRDLKTAIIAGILNKYGLSRKQRSFILESRAADYITDKVRQYLFVKKHYPDQIKGESKYLYCSLRDNWTHESYTGSKKRNQKRTCHQSIPDLEKTATIKQNQDKEALKIFEEYSEDIKSNIIKYAEKESNKSILAAENQELLEEVRKGFVIRWIIEHEPRFTMARAG